MASARLYGSDRAREIHRDAPAIDLHADPLIMARYVGYDLNKRHSPLLPYGALFGHTDVPRMQDGGVGAQFFGLVAMPKLPLDRDLNGTCHRQIDLLERAIAQSEGRLVLARSGDEVRAAAATGKVAALLGLEGAHNLLGSLEQLDRFARRGLRYLGLLHFSANECGAPAKGLGSDSARGLTDFGRTVVERCEELGVIVDLAHINERGFFDACEVASKPVIVSHTGVTGVFPMWRNITDEQLCAVADKGGVVGIIFCPRFLGRDGVDAVADHILHVSRVAGEDTPALGSDWDGFIRPTRGLEESSKLPNLTDALLARGVTRPALEKLLRLNVLRVLDAVT